MADGKVIIEIEADGSEAEKSFKDVKKEAENSADGVESLGDAADDTAKDVDELGDKAEKAKDEVKDLGDEAENSGDGFEAADVAIGTFISNGISSLISGITDAVKSFMELAESTKEYRNNMAKLETAFKSQGKSAEAASEAYEDFYKILGDSGQATEAVNFLAELTDNQKDLEKWTTIAAGVYGKFGTSLPIESLTEAANETAKVGAITGSLADAISWASVSNKDWEKALSGNAAAMFAFRGEVNKGATAEDAFNAALAACSTEQERASLITSALTFVYQDAATEYNNLTASTQAANEATANLEASQAAIGAAMEPLTTAWTQYRAEAFEKLLPYVERGVELFFGLTEALFGYNTEGERHLATARETNEAAQALNETYTAYRTGLIEGAVAELAHIDNTRLLYEELQTLATENGNVLATDKDRVNFILGELNEAYGTEYELIGLHIQGYKDLQTEIAKAIELKQAEVLLGLQYEAYEEALAKRGELEQTQTALSQELSAQRIAATQAEMEWEELNAVLQEKIAKTTNANDLRALSGLADTVTKKKLEFEREQEALKTLEDAYNTNEGVLQGYYNDIGTYQEASTLLMKGETTKAIKVLEDRNNAFVNATDLVGKSREEQLAILEQQVVDTEVNARLMKERYEAGVDGVTRQMVLTAEAQAKTAREEFSKIGEDITDGIGTGAESGKSTLASRIAGLVESALAAARAAADSHSPSRKFRDLVGITFPQGIAVGVEKGEPELENAIDDQVKDIIASYQDADISGEISGNISGVAAAVQATVSASKAGVSRTTIPQDNGTADIMRAIGIQTAGINSLSHEYRRGSGSSKTVVLEVDGRELGRAVVDFGGAEETRIGTRLSVGAASGVR